jgi:hypothetical protein
MINHIASTSSRSRYDIALLLTGLLIGAGAADTDAADLGDKMGRAEKVELSDAALDLVTAGAAEVDSNEDIVTFAATKATASGKTVTANGSFQLLEAVNSESIGNLILSDGAQGNLRSLININAVNSEVNILLNLNINIDSEVGTLNQLNLNGVVPGLPMTRR